MKKKILTILLGVMGGITFLSGYTPSSRAASQTSAASETSDSQTSDTMDEINRLVAEGTFDSASLTKKQISAITTAYGQDPQAIRELQKKSDANKEDSASLYTLTTGSYTHDSQFDGCDIINGIDISRWQGTIDWTKVKASGVQFAIIRVALRTTESGVLEADALYKQNLEGAIAAGLDVGVYVYSQAITTAEAKAEADYTMNLIKGYNITLPIVMDFEYYTNNSGRLARANLSVTEATKICNAFCKEVESKKYTAMVYANKSLLTNDVNASAIAKNYQIWLAQYPGWDSATNSIHASYEGKYSYWQYTSSGSVDGINGNVDMNFRYVKKPSTVKNLRSSAVSMQKVTFKWDKVPYVYGYRIYRYNKETKTYLLIGSTVGAGNTSFTDKNLAVKTLYSYKVRAYYKVNYSKYYGGYSNVINISTQQKTVEDLEIDSRSKSSIDLSWTPQTEVSGYQIVRYDSAAGKYKTIGYVKDAEINTYSDEGLVCGTTYSYKVRAYYEEDGHRAYFDYSNVAKGNTKPGTVTGLSASSTQNSVTLKWNAQVNVDGYYVYVLNSSSKWERIATIKNKSTASYTHKNRTGCTNYKYTVVAYYKKSGKTIRTDRADAITIMTNPAAVKNLSLASAKKDSIRISWKKSANVSGYLVYYKENVSGSSWKRVAKLPSSTTSWTEQGLSSNTKYKFKVKTYYKNNSSTTTSAAAVISVKTAPEQVSGAAVKSYGSKQLLRWDAQSAADGYIIYRYNKERKTFTRIATLSNPAVNSYVINAKASSKYKYCISAYNKVSGKTYKATRSDFAVKKSDTQTADILCSVLNVRKGAGSKYSVTATATNGTKLKIKGIASGWYKVTFKKKGVTHSGYVSASYIQIN